MCLSETWDKNNQTKFKDWKPNVKCRPAGREGYGGVSIFSHPAIKMVNQPNLHTDIEIAWSKIDVDNTAVLLASVYIPPGNIADLDVLDQTLHNIPADTPLILVGDFNSTSRMWDNRRDLPRGTSFRMGIRLEEMIAEHNLQVHNTGHYTYCKANSVTGTVHKSAIDICITRGIRCTIRWTVDIVAALKSDHLACIAEFKPTNPSPPRTKWDLKDVEWSVWEASLAESLQDWIQNSNYDENDIDSTCNSLTETIISCAERCIPKKSVCKHSRPFMTPALKQLQASLKRARKDFKYRSDENNERKLNKCQEEYTTAYLEARSRWWAKFLSEVSAENIWQAVNKIKNSHGHTCIQPIRNGPGPDDYLFDDVEICQRMEAVHIHRSHITPGNFDDDWKEHVEHHVRNVVQSEHSRIREPAYRPEEYNRDISQEDIQRALSKMNQNASPGPDAILPVMLSRAKNAAVPYLHGLFNKCWSAGRIPSVWKKDDRIYLPKPAKPDYHIEKAYRPLSLNSVVGKTFESTATFRYVWFLHTQHQVDT